MELSSAHRLEGDDASVAASPNSKFKQRATEVDPGLVSLSIPVQAHYPSSLAALRDSKSSFSSVARVCQGLTQYASASTAESSHFVESSCLYAEEVVAKEVTEAIQELSVCAKEHSNPKCRILALE